MSSNNILQVLTDSEDEQVNASGENHTELLMIPVHDSRGDNPLIPIPYNDNDTDLTPKKIEIFQENIARIKVLFAAALIPEMEILDKSAQELQNTVDYLDNLRNLVRTQIQEVHFDLFQDADLVNLLEKIGREMDLYNINIESIKKETLNDLHGDPVSDEILSGQSFTFDSNSKRDSTASDIFISSLQPFPSTSRLSLDEITESQTPHLCDDPIFFIPPGPAGVLKWTVLRSLSLLVKDLEATVGQITCFIAKNYSVFVALLRMVNPQELLTVEFQFGSVSSIDVSPDHSLIIAGCSLGHISLWDSRKMTLLKHIEPVTLESEEGHISGSAIVAVGFHSNDRFYSADIQGSAFFHEVQNRILFTSFQTIRIHGKANAASRLLTTTIHSLSPLRKSTFRMFSDPYCLVAITSPFKIAIMSMKPAPQIQYRATWGQLNKSDREVNSKVIYSELKWWTPQSKKEPLDARFLAFTYGPYVALLLVTCKISQNDSSKKKLIFDVCARNEASTDIVALEWINFQFLACLTVENNVKFYDTNSLELIEQVSLSPRTLISQPLWPVPTAIQAKTINLVASRHHSICCNSSRMFILAKQEICCFATLLSWQDRLSILMKSGKFEAAFQMGLDLFNGKNNVVALNIPMVDRKVVIAAHMKGLILNLVSMTMSGYDCHGLEEDYQTYIPTTELVFRTCITLELKKLLFVDIWERYISAGLQKAFLEVLQSNILCERIDVVTNPEIVQRMFDGREMSENEIKRLEQVILHLNPASLDIHNTLHLSGKLGMLNALIYIYTRGLKDFISPLVVIIRKVALESQTAIKSASSMQNVYTLFVYLAYTLTGKAFPIGDLEPAEAIQASIDIFNFLLSPVYIECSSPLHGEFIARELKLGQEPWPYLYFLLKTDTRELMNLTNTIFQNSLLDTGIPLKNETSKRDTLITRQYVIDILFFFVKSGNCDQLEIDIIYSFICRAFKQYQKDYITFSIEQGMEIFDTLVSSSLEETKPEREFAVLSLYETGFVPQSVEADENEFLNKFEKAYFWRLYEKHVMKENNFDLALLSYLRDPTRKNDVFANILKWLENREDWPAIKETVMKYLPDLAFDSKELSKLFDKCWPQDHAIVLQTFSRVLSDQYNYLETILNPLLNHLSQEIFSLESEEMGLEALYPNELYDSYFELMCQIFPVNVHKYAEYSRITFAKLPFSLLKLKNLAKKYNLVDTEIWILIKERNIKEAVILIFEKILKALEPNGMSDFDSLSKDLKLAITTSENYGNSQELWFLFLDRFYFQIDLSMNVHSIKLGQNAISAVLKHISAPDILLRLIDQREEKGFGEYRTTFFFLLDSYEHQKQALEHTLRLATSTAHEEFQKAYSISKSSFSPTLGQCQLCRNFFHLRAMTLEEQKGNLAVFRCHHAFHQSCLIDVLEKAHVRMNLPGKVEDYDLWCIVCGSPSAKKRKGKSPMEYPSTSDYGQSLSNSFSLVSKRIDKLVYPSRDLMQIYRKMNLDNVNIVEDEINLNEDDVL